MAPRAPFALPRQITHGPASGRLDGESAAAQRIRRDDGGPVSLLDPIDTRDFRAPVFRLASDRSIEDFIDEEGYDSTSAAELMELVAPTATRDLERAILDAPFKPRPRLARAGDSTRFSDGSFSVFYGALEADTVEAEIRYWHPRRSTRTRTAHYIRFVCDFSGQTKDLRPMRAKWPQPHARQRLSFLQCARCRGGEIRSGRSAGTVCAEGHGNESTGVPATSD